MIDEKEYQYLKDNVNSLRYDTRVADLTTEECDFSVFNDPPKATEQHKGELVSTIESVKYLNDLANLLDWQGKKSLEDPEKKKYAPYKFSDAAKVRRIITLRFRQPKQAKREEGDIPF